jgi:class 3 adenylate cyclase/tetratricopeptide (TPR) repeat protein
MHRIVPEIIIENYRAGRDYGTFNAASMFLDISGFSAMTDALMGHGQHGAEVLASMMRAVFDPLVQAIFEQGGMIVGYAGDSITALYEIDTDASSAARRALASAHLIQQGLKANPFYETPYGTYRISAKIGLAIGSVSWGILRSRNGEKATFYFRGDAVDDAAAAEHRASAGDIILTPGIHECLGADIGTEPLASFYTPSWVPDNLSAARPVALPPVDLLIASIFAPQEVITQDLPGEFRQAVHMFIRIPDLAHEQLTQFMYTFFDLQARYGGLIERIDFGDKGCNMLVLWGAPVAYKNDIGRALNFIVELRAGMDFAVTAGVTYYTAHAGYIGGRLYETYTCYGRGINLAARFMMSALQNEIWLDERIVQRLRKRFNFDYVGEQNFKGFAQKQKVYVLRGRKSEADAVFQGRMAGRESEFQTLSDFVAPLWDGKYAGVIGIWGEAGMGKSRLVHEFWRSPIFLEHRCLWALCQSDQILRHSLNPFRYWLFRYFDIPAAQDDASRLQKFSSRLDELISFTPDPSLAGELERTRSFLAALVDLEWSDSLYEQLDAQGRYDNTIIALVCLLKAESLRQPLVLFIEDAHFLDEDSKAFVPRLKRALLADTASYPIAIIMTTRWQGTKVLLEDGLLDRDIDLNGLSHGSIASIAGDILGQPAAPALIELVEGRAEGNPFFAEQILSYLRDEKMLELSASGWKMKETWKSSVLPLDISTMLVARLDQLARQVKDVVQAASVLGREFEVQVLARMLTKGLSLHTEIEQAEKASVWSPLNEIRYIFNHSLMRDVAYNMQLQARLQELHSLAFTALEDLYHEELPRHYGELAYHSEQAALMEQARRYLRHAGDSALDTYRNLEAIDYYGRALALVPRDDLPGQFDLLWRRTEAYDRKGDRDAQSRDLDALEELAQNLGNGTFLARIWNRRAYYSYSTGDFAHSVESAKRVMDLIEDGDDDGLLIDAYITSSLSLLRLGKLEDAMKQAKESLVLAQRSGMRLEQGRTLNTMGLIALEQKKPTVAQKYLMDAVAIAREVGDLVLEGKALNNLANSAGIVQGDFALAREYYEQAYAIVHQRGDRYGEGVIVSNLGWCAGMQGHFTAARAYLEQSLSISREVGNVYQETYTLINLSSAAGIQGQAVDAMQYAMRAYEMSLKISERSGVAWSHLFLGHGYALAKEFEKAQRAYADSIRVRNELEQPGLAMEPMAGLIEVALHTNDWVTALGHTEVILAHLAGGGTFEGTEEPLRIYLACYNALEKAKDPRAHDLLQTAVRLLEAQVSRFRDEAVRRMYVQNVPWRLSIQKAWEAQADSD